MNRGESPASSQGASFTDIGESPFRDAIVRCCRRGWFLGVAVTRFGPSRPMTRGMLAAVLHRAAGSPSLDRRGFFPDVSPRAYYGEAADWCACRGLMEGGGNGRFFPDRSLSWEELALALWRWRGSPREKNASGDEAVSWARENGLFPRGSLGRFVLRGQAAQVLDRFWSLP